MNIRKRKYRKRKRSREREWEKKERGDVKRVEDEGEKGEGKW